MQNRYAGDIGDFGKLGLLRCLHHAGLSIGVNWYLVPDEKHNSDGRYVQYLKDESYRRCDEDLWLALKSVVGTKERKVSALENENLLDAVYYSVPLDCSGKTKSERAVFRDAWHNEALHCLEGLNVVFVDPDNGLLVPSAAGTRKDIKYVTQSELADYYNQGSSVIYYQHKARISDQVYANQHRELVKKIGKGEASCFGLKFTKTSQRYYFFIVQPKHKDVISKVLQKMLSTEWGKCFTDVYHIE